MQGIRGSCFGQTYAETDGYPSCASFDPAKAQTIRQVNSDNIIAIGQLNLDNSLATRQK